MIPKSILRALTGEPILIFGDGSQTRDYTYVEDIVRGIIEAAKCDETTGKTYNIGSNHEVSINQVAETILRMIGTQSSKIDYLKNRPGDVLRLHADSTAFNEITNWNPEVSIEDGLSETIQWFKSRPEGISELFNQEEGVNWE
jgi:UDP-glucose 4-epimerase